MQTATVEKPANGKGHAPDVALVKNLAIDLIDESPTNPRKTFTKLDELAADIKLHGVLEPVLVRPHPKKPGRHELVFGARRFRSTKLAGLVAIPAMIRELDDAKALELQIVENSQRTDIHPLEEADGYQALHEKHGFSVEEIAAKVGKSPATIYQRLKLVTLGAEARKAFLDGWLSAAVAIMVASLPIARQKDFLKELEHWRRDGDPPSRSDALHVLKSKFHLVLADAPFDRGDAKLVVGAPACGSCPKRTGAQADLFGTGKDKDDVCLDATCFESKCDATWKKRVAAKAENERVMSETETKKIFSNGGRLPYDSNYVDLGDRDYSSSKSKTWGEALGKKRSDVEVVLARDEAGKLRELVAKKEFAAAVPKSGIKVTKTKARKTQPSSPAELKQREKDWAKKDKERRAKEAEHHRAEAALVDLVVEAAVKKAPNDGFWRVLLRSIMRVTSLHGPCEAALVAGLGLKLPKGNGPYTPKFQTQLYASASRVKPDRARALIVRLLVADDLANDRETLADFQALYDVKASEKKKEEPAEVALKKKPAKKTKR